MKYSIPEEFFTSSSTLLQQNFLNIIFFFELFWHIGSELLYPACHFDALPDGEPMQLLLNVGGPDRVSRFQMAEAVAQIRGYNTSLIKAVSASSVSKNICECVIFLHDTSTWHCFLVHLLSSAELLHSYFHLHLLTICLSPAKQILPHACWKHSLPTPTPTNTQLFPLSMLYNCLKLESWIFQVDRGVKSPADISMDVSRLIQKLGIYPVSFIDGVKLTLDV